jgi:hypothetical protein
MATTTAIPALQASNGNVLRTQMEELLFDFYSVMGVATRRQYPVMANELLTDNFQGRFFIQSSSELMCFSKAQMLASKVGRGGLQGPACQLTSMNASYTPDGCVAATYAAAFRYGQTSMVRRGAFKAVETEHGWSLRSLDEDVRVVLLPESRRKLRNPSDQPRVWIL